MTEQPGTAVRNITDIKENRSGTLKLENGRVSVDTGTNVYSTALIASDVAGAGDEAAIGEESNELKYAVSHPNATGVLRIDNGYLYLTNESGKVTLENNP